MRVLLPLDYYRHDGVRALCHAVKGHYGASEQDKAISVMAERFINAVGPGDIIIPAPQHMGRADYTLRIAEIVARETGSRVVDILRRCPEDSLYQQRMNGSRGVLNMYKEGSLPSRGRLFFLDNVWNTGLTYFLARELVGGELFPLIYAKNCGK